jgi:penicillin G amidase
VRKTMVKRPRQRAALAVLALVVAVLLAAGSWGFIQLRASLPTLEGRITAANLSGPVTIFRDERGVPTLVAQTRADLAFALGYLHAQERYFQMDGQRRTAAGELSELVGPIALKLDRSHRLHRFRSRGALIAAMPPAERAMLDAYTARVNTGLDNLGARPLEYWLLRSNPGPWTPEDTVLTAFSMYLTLQQPLGATERWRADAVDTLGLELTEFLLPEGTSWDAPLDGSHRPYGEQQLLGSLPRSPLILRRSGATPLQ